MFCEDFIKYLFFTINLFYVVVFRQFFVDFLGSQMEVKVASCRTNVTYYHPYVYVKWRPFTASVNTNSNGPHSREG